MKIVITRFGIWLARVCLLPILFPLTIVAAAEIVGTVSAVDGRTVTIDIDPGARPSIGDRVEISFVIGEKKFMVGDWQVTAVAGTRVQAREQQVKLPVDTGMQAVIYTGTGAVAPSGKSSPDASMPATAAESKAQENELFWRDPDNQKQETQQPAPQATVQTRPEDELFWLKPGYQHGDRPETVRAAETRQRPPRAPPPVTEASVLPPERAGDGAIQTVTTREYSMIWNDSGSGAAVDFATFRPVGPPGYFPLGDVAVAGPWRGPRYGAPAFTTLMVKEGRLPLARPEYYRLIWSSRGSNSNRPFSSWEPIAPSGFQCLGEVGSTSLDREPSRDAIRCIPEQCVAQVGIGQKIWDDRGSGAAQDFSAWRIPELNLYIGIASHGRPRNTVSTIRAECR